MKKILILSLCLLAVYVFGAADGTTKNTTTQVTVGPKGADY